MNLKKIVAAGIAAVCAVSMAACGGSGDSSKVTDMQYKDIKLGETGKDIKANLKLFSHRTDMLKKDYPGTTWDQYIAEFNKMYPNIKVTVEANSDYANSAMTRLQGGDWGDIMMIPAVDRAELQNYFISYGSLGDMDKEVKYAVNQSYQKKVYGVASVGNASGIVYNKKVFKDAGIDSLPTTPDEFISDLKAVKNKTQAIPLYTNYAAGWTMGAWDAYIGGTATGDPDYMNNVFTHSKNPFKDPGDGTHSYNVYKILYDAVADGLTEDDYSTTDWESSKNKLNAGEIATMVLGSWAVSQIQAAGDNGEDVGYMPFPISVKGKQYATSAPDYAYGINKNSSTTDQEAAMIFVKWMTEKSNFAYNEGGSRLWPTTTGSPTSTATSRTSSSSQTIQRLTARRICSTTSTLIPNSTSTAAATPASRASSSTLPTRTSPTTISFRNGTRSGTTPLIPKASILSEPIVR